MLFDSLFQNKHKPVASIQQQYIIVAVILGIFVIAVSVAGYMDMVRKTNALVHQVNMISGLLEKNVQFRNHISAAKHAIDTFMLEPERVNQKKILSQELNKATGIIKELKSNSLVRSLPVAFQLQSLTEDISALDKQSKELFRIRVNVNEQYPAMEVSANVMRPSRNAIFSILNISINEFHEGDETLDHNKAFELLIQAQNAWISTIAEYRLYLANRIGSFNEQGLREQEINVETFIERMEKISKQLQAYNDMGLLGFESSEMVETLPVQLGLWKKGFQKVKEINHSERWRQDSQLMRDSIVPLLDRINQTLIELDNKIKDKDHIVLNQLKQAGTNQNMVLAGVIFLFLIYISLSIYFLRLFIIKPIALIANTLKHKALGHNTLFKLKIKKTRETQDLLQAFDELSHQIIQRQNALKHQALNDSLTSLPNRLKLQERLDYHLKIAQREKRTLIFMMLDLNHFKEVNDTLGHHIGDKLLIQVGKRLKETLRDMDTVARLGGDEFAILLPDAKKENAIAIAEKINQLIESPFKVHNYTLHISVSIGISEFPNDGKDMNTLMQHSDVAMYISKKKKTKYSFYDPNADLHSVTRLSLGNDLRLALEKNELYLYYQPKYSLTSNKITGVEVLLRWQHPSMGFVSPELIIETAEHMGFINELSYWIIEQAVSECASCHQKGMGFNIAINLSVHNLRDADLCIRINKALEQYKLKSENLTLEVTESAMMTNPEQSIEVLNQLSENGINISVDDFGTGFSSLAYLKQLPVCELKIDKSFVIDMRHDKNDAVIVRSTIELGHNLGLQVVAEGVEDQETWNMLKHMNCDYAQGYFMTRPLAPENFRLWLKSNYELKLDEKKTGSKLIDGSEDNNQQLYNKIFH